MFANHAPIMLSMIDTERRIKQLIPHLDKLVLEGLIAMSRMEGIPDSRDAQANE